MTFTQPPPTRVSLFQSAHLLLSDSWEKSGWAEDNEIKAQHTHTRHEAPGKKHTVNINLSDRKSKSGICHTSSSLSPVFLKVKKKDERGGGFGGMEDEVVRNSGHGLDFSETRYIVVEEHLNLI